MSRTLSYCCWSFAAAVFASAAVTETSDSMLPISAHMVLQGARSTIGTVAGASFPALYRGVYPGIDVKYYRREDRDALFEYDFIIAPGADPSHIRLEFPNATSLAIDGTGDLVVHAATGAVRHRRPYSYQTLNGRQVEIASAFRISGRTVTFDLGQYDRGATLVIDPEVIYSTPVTACCLQALGADGSAYHASWASGGSNLPAGPVFQKLNPAGQSQYSLPFNSTQQITAVAVDTAGAFYAVGPVNPAIPPPLFNAVRTTPASGYLAKVRPDGAGFVFVTYYEGAIGPMTVAADGSIFIASATGTPAVTKIASSGAVVWTHNPNFGVAGVAFTDIATEGTAVFAGGGNTPNVAAFAKLGAGADPAAGAYVKTWTTTASSSAGSLVEPDGSGGVFVARIERSTGCVIAVTLLRLDGAGNEAAAAQVPTNQVACNQFTDGASGTIGPRSLARAANGDIWLAGTEGLIGTDLSRAFARRYPPSLSAPSVSAASSQPREPLIGPRQIQSLEVDASGAIYTVSNAVLAGGFLARKTSMTNISPVGVPGGITAAQPASGHSAVGVSWQAVAGATGYQVSVIQNPFGAYSVVQDVSGGATTSALIPVVQSVQTASYTVTIRACLNGFGDTFCGESARTATDVSLRPVILTPAAGAALTGSTVAFSWENVPGFTSHRLTVLRNGQQVFADWYNAPLNQAFYSLPSGNYTMRLAGSGNGIFSEVTRTFTIQLPAVPNSSPAIQSAVVSGGNSVTVNFPTVAGADLYLIQVIQPNTGPGGGALTVAARMVSASPVTLQIPAGAASVVVSACNGDGCAPHSAPVAINPAGPSPSTPVISAPAAGTYVTGPVVFFAWSRIPGDNGSNTTYRLYVQDMERQAPSGNIYTTQNFWAMRLQPGKRYDAIVLVRVNGQDVQSAVANFVLSGPPVQSPTPVIPGYQETAVPRRQDGSIVLAWAPVPGASTHQWILYPSSGAPIVSGLEFTDSHGVFGLPSGNYTGKVRACLAVPPATCAPDSDVGWGQWSDAAGTGPWVFTLP